MSLGRCALPRASSFSPVSKRLAWSLTVSALLVASRPIRAFQPSSTSLQQHLQVRQKQLSSTSFTATRINMSSTANKDTTTPPQHVVIAGAGVIGLSTAYFLQKEHGISCTLVDPSGTVAPAASGKAGGFLALDWNDHSPVGPLARRSFALHQQLADTLGADSIDYRRLTCASIRVNASIQSKPSGKKLQGVEWVEDSQGMQTLGNEETIAQVHPKRLCERLWQEVSQNDSCQLKQGSVVGAVHDDQGQLVGAKLQDVSIVKGDALVFCCGPWVANIMQGIKYHSVVVPTDRVLQQCVFFSGCGDPEVYVRPDSTAYLTGFPDAARFVTEQPGQEEVCDDKTETILTSVQQASGGSMGMGSDPVLKQACYLPTTNDGIPVMGRLPEQAAGGGQCYMAAGHSCWGILLGPATGEAMASLIAMGADIRPFDPARYGDIKPVSR